MTWLGRSIVATSAVGFCAESADMIPLPIVCWLLNSARIRDAAFFTSKAPLFSVEEGPPIQDPSRPHPSLITLAKLVKPDLLRLTLRQYFLATWSESRKSRSRSNLEGSLRAMERSSRYAHNRDDAGVDGSRLGGSSTSSLWSSSTSLSCWGLSSEPRWALTSSSKGRIASEKSRGPSGSPCRMPVQDLSTRTRRAGSAADDVDDDCTDDEDDDDDDDDDDDEAEAEDEVVDGGG